MVVTCENCSARYKLDDSRISGRGAKITCPRCRHVFVVYKESLATDAESKMAVGGGVVSSGVATPTEVEPDEPVVAPVAAEVDVDKLDFRRVGIQAWKVKVKIGLIYDFSDYRTLARYIAEGRVTPSDKLSHDGRTWTEISEIGDLAGHFITVYRSLEAEQAAAAAAAEAEDEAEDYDDDEPTNIMGMGGDFNDPAAKPVSLTSFSSSAAPRILPSGGSAGAKSSPVPSAASAELGAALDAALEAETPKRNAPSGPKFIDPFEKRKASGRRPKASAPRERPRTRPSPSPSPSSEGGSSLGWIALIVVALLGGGGWWWSNQQAGVTKASPRRVDVAPSPAQSERDREKLRRQIEEDIGATPTELAPEEPVDDGFEVDEEPEPIPVPPKDRGKRASSPGDPNASLPSADGGSASSDLADGEAAFQRRDYRAAAAAFQRAVDKDPKNATYNGRLGAALARAGDSDSAMAPLLTAADGGYTPALVYLGDLAQLTNDTAGAVGYYQSYLATDPPDARAIQVKLDRLLGG